METLTDLSHEKAKEYFLKGSSYFNQDFPKNIKFESIIEAVSKIMKGKCFKGFENGEKKPSKSSGVNYELITNKDGKLAWRPLELIHPVIYVSLVNVICEEENWNTIKDSFKKFEEGVVNCCSVPVDNQSRSDAQMTSCYKQFEQRSLAYSLEFSHVLHTDVADCYGSLYTHSISWALHGVEEAKERRCDNQLLGNKIDEHIRAGRYGQTNGISQGSVLMDFVAEIVLGFVDCEINKAFKTQNKDFRILRYRDDYKIFANNDDKAEKILKIISDKLRVVGMKLNTSKTYSSTNVIESSIKPDKLAGINLQGLDLENTKTIQKQLLRLHSFGQRFPNSGALNWLVSELQTKIENNKLDEIPNDIEAQVAIVADIAFVSPATFPAIAGILSHLISLAPDSEKNNLRKKVRNKMKRVPYNGYLEIWLQRIIDNDIKFSSKEAICKIVNKEKDVILWENDWISSNDLLAALKVSQILISSHEETSEIISSKETQLFAQNAYSY